MNTRTKDPNLLRIAAGSLLVLFLIAYVWFLASCSKPVPPPMATAVVLTPAQVYAASPGAICLDTSYAQVNSAWLAAFYPQFRDEIFRLGVVQWDERFDCNHFAGFYVELAQTKFYLATWLSSTPAQTLAIGTYVYPSPKGEHEIVEAITEIGPVFIEPQTGERVTLTDAEKNGAQLKIF